MTHTTKVGSIKRELRKQAPHNLKHGDRVRVTGRGPGDHSEAGRVGTFVEYTPRGFARVRLDPKPGWKDREPDIWLIHPESLENAADRH